MSYTLNAVAAALSVHPRTILRLTTGHVNPYWADGYDPEVDVAMIAVLVGSSIEAIDTLIAKDDHAIGVDECAVMFKIKLFSFYHLNLTPDWQVGRVKRYSFNRIAKLAVDRKARAK